MSLYTLYMASDDIDSTVDLGFEPKGLSRTKGLCNYQWGVTGPLGALIFYCTNEQPCDGLPHRVQFGSWPESDCATVEWTTVADVQIRTAEAQGIEGS